MSGSCWYYGTYGDFQFEKNVDFIENLVKEKKLDERGYFIYHAVGTEDAVKYQSEEMASEMLSRATFTPDHYVFYRKEGGLDEFFEKTTYPCIVHWRFTHFVVVCGRRGNTVYINDPASGSEKITMQEFDEAYTGLCLRFSPGEDFEPTGSPRSMVSYLKENLKEAKSTVFFVAAASLIVSLTGLLLPAASRVFLDRILSGANPGWLKPLLAFLGVLCLIELVVGCVQAVYQMRLFGVLGIRASSRYMWHIFHLPADFFFQRQPGDLQQNEESNRLISETLILRIVPLITGLALMLIRFSDRIFLPARTAFSFR